MAYSPQGIIVSGGDMPFGRPHECLRAVCSDGYDHGSELGLPLAVVDVCRDTARNTTQHAHDINRVVHVVSMPVVCKLTRPNIVS